MFLPGTVFTTACFLDGSSWPFRARAGSFSVGTATRRAAPALSLEVRERRKRTSLYIHGAQRHRLRIRAISSIVCGRMPFRAVSSDGLCTLARAWSSRPVIRAGSEGRGRCVEAKEMIFFSGERGWFLALLSFACAACGSSTPNTSPSAAGAAGAASVSNGGSGGASTLSQTQAFEAAAATATCKVLFSCSCNLVATALCTAGQCPTTQADCANALQGHFSPPNNAVFQADQATACLNALGGNTCDIPPACAQVYQVTSKPGSSCLTNDDCTPASPNQTAYCSFKSTTCVEYSHAAQGQACVTSCAGGSSAVCNSESASGGAACWFEDGLRCLAGVCAPLGTAGAACTDTDTLQGCDASDICSAGMCQLSGTAVGGTCSASTTQCAGHAYCAASGTCQAVEVGGAACVLATDCASGVCHAGQCTGSAPDAKGVCAWF